MKTVRLIFGDAMARAIVEGRKTVTRRPVAPNANQRWWLKSASQITACPSARMLDLTGSSAASFDYLGGGSYTIVIDAPCTPGDLLIGQECWRPVMESWRSFVEYRAGGELDVDGRALFVAERGIALRFPGAKKDVHTEKWHPSIHMPDWAARIRRRVLSVTVERVQDITEEDAVREGFTAGLWGNRDTRACGEFSATWDDIYAERGLGWFSNPWVWRIEFGAESVEAVK